MNAIDVTGTAERYDVPAARRALLAIFLVSGFVMATWIAYIPIVKERFGLGDGALGLTLLAVSLGSIGGLLLTGSSIGRFGSRKITSVTTLGLCCALPLVVLNPLYPFLVAMLMLFGLMLGSMDVAMNAQAVAVETRLDRPVMSTFHALFSVGGLLGAGSAGLLIWLAISPTIHVIGVALLMAVVGLVSLRSLLPTSVDQTSSRASFVRPTGPLMTLGIIAFLALISEGAVGDWSAVYLHEGLGTNPGFAASGFAVFSLTMTLGRFLGDPLRARMRSERLVRLSGGLAAAGLGIALVVGNPVAALIGFACVGVGLSNVVPVVFSAAGQTSGIANGAAIAAVATAGYLGFIVGPPVIGYVSQATSLPLGLGIVVVFLSLIAVLADNVRPTGGAGRSTSTDRRPR